MLYSNAVRCWSSGFSLKARGILEEFVVVGGGNEVRFWQSDRHGGFSKTFCPHSEVMQIQHVRTSSTVLLRSCAEASISGSLLCVPNHC